MPRVDPFATLANALAAHAPHPSLVEASGTYNWLVGAWDSEVFDLEADGARRVSSAEWYFAWVLEGYAMQDVFISPRREDRLAGMPPKGNRYGTSLRIYDSTIGAWRIHWFNPVTQRNFSMIGKMEGDDLVQRGVGPEGFAFRWTFSKIDADNFRWRSERIEDGVAKLVVEAEATRRKA